jgi:hypothetical protein
MKLAEALILRSDCQRRIEQLKQRLLRSARVQEGDEPAEDPKELRQELDHALEELTQLIKGINKTNSVTGLEPGVSISSAQSTVKVTTTCRLVGTVRVGKGNYLPVVFPAQWNHLCRNGSESRGTIPRDERKADRNETSHYNSISVCRNGIPGWLPCPGFPPNRACPRRR